MPEASDVRKAIATVELRSGLGLRQGEVQLGHGVDLGDAGHRIMAFYLHDFEVTRAYQSGGYASIVQYAQLRWDLDRRRTQELVRIGGRLRELPRIDEALCAREISWSKVVELCKVAVPEYEEKWLKLAKGMGCVALRTEVKLASASGKPREPGDRKGLPEVRFDVSCRVSALVREKLDLARDKLYAERGMLFGDAELLEAMADLLLESEEDGGVAGRTRVPASQFVLVLRPDTAGDGLVLDGDQGEVPLGEVESACAICDGQVLAMRDDEGARGDELARDGEGVREVMGIAAGSAEASLWLSAEEAAILDRATPAWLRARVLLRDGERCRCCGQRRQIQAHHIRWRVRRGRTRADNLLTLCKGCHSLVHAGLLVLKGKHEKEVVFVDREGRLLRDGGGSVNRTKLVELKREFGRCYGAEVGFGAEAQRSAARKVGESEGGSLDGSSGGNRGGNPSGILDGRLGGTLAGGAHGCFVRLNDVPREIDAQWWAAHEALMRLRKGGGLEFRESFVAVPERSQKAHSSQKEHSSQKAHRGKSVGAESPPEAAGGPTSALGVEGSVGERSDQVARSAWDDAESRLIGREDVVARLRGEALGSRRRGKAFPHTLFAGPAGTGKTSLAVMVAQGCEGKQGCGGRMHRAQGPLVQDVPALLRLVMGMGEGDFLFLDEIHAIPGPVLETLYEVMEGGVLSLNLYSGNRSRCVSLHLPKVTVLGATTEPASLPGPLLSRFGVVEYLPYYESEELVKILLAQAEIEGVELAKKAAQRMALCARGTPREALRILDSVFNQLAARQGELARYGEQARQAELTRATLRKVTSVLERLGYSKEGYSPLEQRYLTCLREQKGPVSLRRLALALGCPTATLVERVEPWLSQQGLVEFTPRGRVAGQPVEAVRPNRQVPRLLKSEPSMAGADSMGWSGRDCVSEEDSGGSADWVSEGGRPWHGVPDSGRTGLTGERGLPGLALPG